MTNTKKGTKTLEGQKYASIFLRLQQIEIERRKAEHVEQMIEAKVDLALRRLIH